MADRDFRIDLILGAKFAQAFAEMKQADARVRGLGKTVDQVNAKSGNLAGAARATAAVAVAGATAAAAVMSLYIAKTIEAEKVQAQLGARVKDTAGVAGRSLAQLNEQAGKLQSITVFDDEAIGNAQAMLLTFTQIRGVNFDRTIEASLDLATVMGTDATDAAKVLGKALSDPEKGLSALSRAGVTFTAAERERIKAMVDAGQVAEAQGLILDKLSGKMGSAAEAARDTLGGAVQALKNSFDNLMEGDSGDAGVIGTRNAIEALIVTLNDPATKQGFDNIISGLTRAAGAAIKAAAEVSNFTRFVAEEVASRVGGPAADDIVRLEQKRDRDQAVLDQLDQRGTPAARRNQSAYAQRLRADIAAQTAAIELAKRAPAIASAADFAKYRGLPKDFGLNVNPNKSDPAPEGQGIVRPGRSGKSGGATDDPDAAAKKRLAALQEELYLINAIEAGEDKASAAAQARYDTTEGEYAKASPALKAQIVAAAEAVDQANAAKQAEKERAEAIKDSEDAYKDLLDTMRTPAERAIDEAIVRLGVLDEAIQRAKESKQEFDQAGADKARQRIIDQAFEDAPLVGDQAAFVDPFAEDRKRLEAWHNEQLEALVRFRQSKEFTNAEYDAREAEIQKQHMQALAALQVAQSQMLLGATSSMFGSLADIARAGVGEQSKAYRVLFALSKGFAIAQAAVALAQNIAEASKVGFPYNLPLIAGAIAQGAQIAAILSGANYTGGAGYAEGGYTGPGGKYKPAGIVHAGEGVLNQEEIAALGGPSGFYALRDAIDDGRMRELLYGWAGYVDGGLVASPDAGLAPIDWASHPQGMPANGGGRVTLYNLFDQDALRKAVLSHPDTEKAVVVYATQNGQTIKASF